VAGSKTDLILGNTQGEGWKKMEKQKKKKKCRNTQSPGQFFNQGGHKH
jgi:hypothetical protein